MPNPNALPGLPAGWDVELLDWVSACQSSYHIENTPNHRFGNVASNLKENRDGIVEYVRSLIDRCAQEAVRTHLKATQNDDADTKIIGWLRNERGDATGLATWDPLFLLGDELPDGYRATYSPVRMATQPSEKS